NNVDKLKTPERALYSCMLEQHGFVVDDLIVYFLAESHFRLVVNAATADMDIAWLGKLREMEKFDAALKPRTDLAIIAVQGPNARDKVWRALPASEPAARDLKPFSGVDIASDDGDLFIARTGYTGEDGFELMVPSRSAEAVGEAPREAGRSRCGP